MFSYIVQTLIFTIQNDKYIIGVPWSIDKSSTYYCEFNCTCTVQLSSV